MAFSRQLLTRETSSAPMLGKGHGLSKQLLVKDWAQQEQFLGPDHFCLTWASSKKQSLSWVSFFSAPTWLRALPHNLRVSLATSAYWSSPFTDVHIITWRLSCPALLPLPFLSQIDPHISVLQTPPQRLLAQLSQEVIAAGVPDSPLNLLLLRSREKWENYIEWRNLA